MEDRRQNGTGSMFQMSKWTGMADALQDVANVGFELQAEEGNRCGKSLIVYDPAQPFDPLRIQIGQWGARELDTGKLFIFDDADVQQNYERPN